MSFAIRLRRRGHDGTAAAAAAFPATGTAGFSSDRAARPCGRFAAVVMLR